MLASITGVGIPDRLRPIKQTMRRGSIAIKAHLCRSNIGSVTKTREIFILWVDRNVGVQSFCELRLPYSPSDLGISVGDARPQSLQDGNTGGSGKSQVQCNFRSCCKTKGWRITFCVSSPTFCSRGEPTC